MAEKTSTKWSVRLLYLYLFSFVGLLITIIGGIQLIDLGLKTYVFKVSDYSYPVSTEFEVKQQRDEQSNQRKRQMSNSLAMMIVGLPVYFYHWKTIKQEAAQ